MISSIAGLLEPREDEALLPGWTFVLARHGQIVQFESYGARDREAGAPVEPDTIFRVYSMTKPMAFNFSTSARFVK